MTLKEIQDERHQLLDKFFETKDPYPEPDIIERLKKLEEIETDIHGKQDGWWLTDY